MLRPPSHSSFPGILSLRSQFDGDAIVDSTWRGNHVEINRPPSTDNSFYTDPIDEWDAGPSNLERRNTNVIQQIKNFVPKPLELHEEEEADLLFYEDARRFINLSLLSHLAVQLYDNVPRGTHVKGSVPYPRAFTGKDVVVCALSTWFVLSSFLSVKAIVNDTFHHTTGIGFRPWKHDNGSASRTFSCTKFAIRVVL
jgi:hypothetical protein